MSHDRHRAVDWFCPALCAFKSCRDIRSDANVAPGWMIHASEDVNEPLRRKGHLGW